MEQNNNNKHAPGRSNFFPLAITVTFFITTALVLIMLAVKLLIVNQPNDGHLTIQAIQMPSVSMDSQQPHWENIRIEPGDTLAGIFYRYDLNRHDLREILRVPLIKKNLKHIRAGHEIKLLITPRGEVRKLNYQLGINQYLMLSKTTKGYQAKTITEKFQIKPVNAHGVIKSSLFAAAKEAGLPTSLVFQLADIFRWKINFVKDVHPGDAFNVIYEKKYLHGKYIENGNILAAEFYNKGKVYKAVRFINPKTDKTAYYTPTGHSLAKAFIRTPVKYVYISSPFNMHRMHPILHISRPHEGVDLAAYRGTPVKAAGNGRIKFRGRHGGYGNLVIIDHGNGITTRYGHLSRFAKGLKPGKYVKMGQTIAYVGSTGLATGPHLHFEYRIHGVPHNPLTVKLPAGAPVPRQYRASFKKQAKFLVAQLNQDMPSPYQLVSNQ